MNWLPLGSVVLIAITVWLAYTMSKTPSWVIHPEEIPTATQEELKQKTKALPGLPHLPMWKGLFVYLAVDTVLFIAAWVITAVLRQTELGWILCMGPLIVWWLLYSMAFAELLGNKKEYILRQITLVVLIVIWIIHPLMPWWIGYYVGLFSLSGMITIGLIIPPIRYWSSKKDHMWSTTQTL